MSNKILCFLTATSISLLASSTSAYDRTSAANQGNDQNRKAIPGMSILGGGPKAVDTVGPAKANAAAAKATANKSLILIKQEADRIYQEGLALERKNKFVEAADMVRRSLNIRESYFAAIDTRIPEIKEKLADILAKAGKNKEALEMYSNALLSYAKFNGPGSAHRIRPLTAMGSIQLKELNYKGACDCYNQAFMLTQNNKGIASPEAMRLRLQLAATNRAAKSYDLAASLYNECFDLQRKNEKLIDHDQLISSLQDYASVLKELKRDEESEKILARVAALRGENVAPAQETKPLADSSAQQSTSKPSDEVSSTNSTPASESK